MSSFLATEHYHPAVVLIVGLLTSAGIVGLGRGWLRLFRLTRTLTTAAPTSNERTDPLGLAPNFE